MSWRFAGQMLHKGGESKSQHFHNSMTVNIIKVYIFKNIYLFKIYISAGFRHAKKCSTKPFLLAGGLQPCKASNIDATTVFF